MAIDLSTGDSGTVQSSCQSPPDEEWRSFEEILKKLHREGLYIHPEQLAEFLLAHGIPVPIRYVPQHLQEKAKSVNENYKGDMAKLVEEPGQPSWDFLGLE